MNSHPSLDELHDRQVRAVQNAVAKLIVTTGYPAEVVFEGAVKGGAVALLAAGSPIADVAELFATFGEALNELDPPNLRTVQ